MKTAIVIGCATGIGRAISLWLAENGYGLTLIDISEPLGAKTAHDCVAAARTRGGAPVRFIAADAMDHPAMRRAFEGHVSQVGPLDVAVLNAGIGERGDLFGHKGTGWRPTLDLDLTAMIECTKLSVQAIRGSPKGPDGRPRGGAVINVASAAGIFPMFKAPVYAAAKGGLVHFTRSLEWLDGKSQAIRVMSLCPQFVDTPLVERMFKEDPSGAEKSVQAVGGALLTVGQVVEGFKKLLQEGRGGAVLRVAAGGKLIYWPENTSRDAGLASASPAADEGVPGSATAAAAAGRARHLSAIGQLASSAPPASRRVVKVVRLSSDFRAATRIFEERLPPLGGLPAGHVLVRRLFTGINASDVNFSMGRYHGPKAAEKLLPFDAGFESVGVVLDVGPGVKGLVRGSPVATLTYGGFSDFSVEKASLCLPVPEATPSVLALLTSGLTAALALKAGGIKEGKKVLITSAAGGTGQFAVQLAKLAGCHVIATAGGPEKVAMVKRLGADRVIDYKRENLKEVLRSEYPKGVDLVYETIGGAMFDTCVNALGRKGRLLVIGMMSQYTSGWEPSSHVGLAEKLLNKSASIIGFFLPHYASSFKAELARLSGLVDSGRLVVSLDRERFVGLERAPDAVDRLQGGASMGKVVLALSEWGPDVWGQAGPGDAGDVAAANSRL